MAAVTLSLSQTTYQRVFDGKMDVHTFKPASYGSAESVVFFVLLSVLAISIIFWSVGAAREISALTITGKVFFSISLTGIALQAFSMR